MLKDPDKRTKYDRYGAAWKAAQQGSGTPPPGYEDVWFDTDSPSEGFGFSGFSAFLNSSSGPADDVAQKLVGVTPAPMAGKGNG